jgi:hypothetical protein
LLYSYIVLIEYMKNNLLLAGVTSLALSGCSDCTDVDQGAWDLNEIDRSDVSFDQDAGLDSGSDDVSMKDVGLESDSSMEDAGDIIDDVCVTRGEMRDAVYSCYDEVGFVCREDEVYEGDRGYTLVGQKINECSRTGCALGPVDGAFTIFQQERWGEGINKYEYSAVLDRLFGLNCEQNLVDKHGVKDSVTPVWAYDSVLWSIDNGYLSREDALSDQVCLTLSMLDRFEEKCVLDLDSIVSE